MRLYSDNIEKYDSYGREEFKLVQLDERIFDTKFETKPVGYFRDVWYRFCKNKASVVAGIFILIP